MKYIYSAKVQKIIDYGCQVLEEYDELLLAKIKFHVDKLGMDPGKARKAFLSDRPRLELIAQHSRFISTQIPIGVAS